MSRASQNNKKYIDYQNKENINYPNNYTDKKSTQNYKFFRQAVNHSSLSLNPKTNNKVISNNLYTTKGNTNNNHHKNNSFDKTLNNKDDKYITMNDILGEKCKLNLDILRTFYTKYEKSKTSKKKMGIIKTYGVNTYQGTVRNYNEDRVSIIINMNRPNNYHKKNWPKISFFGIYDGHGGDTCSEYLKDNLHKLICSNNEFFPDNIPEAIKLGFQKAEKEFINNYSLNDKKQIIDKSGSCAVIILIIDKKIYVANVGDSRCLLSTENGKKYIEVTQDHKPNAPNEIKRIKRYGGYIYQSETLINTINNPDINGKILKGPFRVVPGRLSVSRTIGDAEAKLEKFGGNPNVIIPDPDIFCYDLDKNNIDFFILGCDGVYDQMSSKEVLDCAWMILNEKEHPLVKQIKDIHNQSGLIVDLILKSALTRKSFDNVTCLFIAFKELGVQFIEQNEKNNKKENNYSKNNTNEKRKSYNYNISPITPLSKPSNLKDKKNFEKPIIIERKTETSIKNNEKYNNTKDDYKNNRNDDNKNNRNNNYFYLSSYISPSNNKKYPSSKTDYKIRNVKLNNNATENKINISLVNNKNEVNNNINNNITIIRLTHSKIHTNSNDYIKTNQSFTKSNSYSIDKYNNKNNNQNTRKANITSYNNNTYTSSNTSINKRISEGSLLNRKNSSIGKINEESPYINNNTTYQFKHTQRYNNYQDTKDNKNNRKNLNSTNNSVSLNNINYNKNNTYSIRNNNHPYSTSNIYIVSTQGNNYSSIRKNNINLNEQNKNQGQIRNYYNNNNTYSSISIRNSHNKKRIEFLNNNKTINNNNNNNINNNVNNNNLLISNEKLIFSQRNQRISTKNIKEEESVTQNTNYRLNLQIGDKGRILLNSNSNKNHNYNILSNYNKQSHIYKSSDKNYQNYSHNTVRNTTNKYTNNNYSIIETNNSKKDIENKNVNNYNAKEGHRYNDQKSTQKEVINTNINENNNDRNIINRRIKNNEYSSGKENDKNENKKIIIKARYYRQRY